MTDLPSPWDPVPHPPDRYPRHRSWGRLILRGLGIALVSILMLILLGIAAGLGIYAYYARSLPSPQEMYERTTAFKSTKIYDRNGRLLFEVIDPLGGRRTIVPYQDIPEVVINATVATEDATFFSNPGLNPVAILRALYMDIRERELVSGASTITQQLVKNLFLTRERTLERKVKEAILAAEITRRYDKTEILEVYLNEVYFGNLSYGIGAAAETYFDKHVSELNLAEAAMLAGMLQSPTIYDPYTNPQAVRDRRETVLGLMLEREYITQAEYDATVNQPIIVAPQRQIMEAPHMVMYVREQLEKQYGTDMLYKGGLQVYTTLDLDLQYAAEEVARDKMAELGQLDAHNAALVALDPRNGDVLAMLGSIDFYNAEIDGQVNVARMLRQPGSTIKPFTYLAALERGWAPSTMLMDVTQAFPDGANPPYKPKNYDNKEYGPISMRTALACSRNIPAVSTLHQIGLPALLEMTQRLGIHSLTRPDYGLSLTLGGGEVTLLELAGAYGALANGGHAVTPRTILRITDQTGRVILDDLAPTAPSVVDARRAYLITNILADDAARIPSFGANSALKLSFPAAAKTGTTNDYRDSWTVGYTPDFVAGVWVGNSDNTPMKNVAGARGAGMIWHDFMERALKDAPHPDFVRPEGLVEVEVCPVSGQKRTDLCPPARQDLFLHEEAPQTACSVHRRVKVCKASGQLATSFCPAETVEERVVQDYGVAWDEWARGKGMTVPPREVCALHATEQRVILERPTRLNGDLVEVRGTTEIGDFAYYVVEYGAGAEPNKWRPVTPRIEAPVFSGTLGQWDTSKLKERTYTLRLLVADRRGNVYEQRVTVELDRPAEPPSSTTPTLAPSPTVTVPAATETPWPTPTVAPTGTPPSGVPPTSLPAATTTPAPSAAQTPTGLPPAPTPGPTGSEQGPTPTLSPKTV